MKKVILGLLVICIMPYFAQAQNVNDKIKWQFNMSVGQEVGTYLIIAVAKIEPGWHVFGQKPGEEFLIPAQFEFADENIQLLSMEEHGVLKSEKMEAVGVVNYYENEVRFTAVVRSNSKVVEGGLYFQICNATMCLPPTTEKFTLSVQ